MLTTLDINIKHIAAPLVGEPKAKKFAAIKSSSVSDKKLSFQLNNRVGVIILAIEGAYQHLKELNKEKSKKLLKDTGKTIEDFYALDDLLFEKKYLDNQELKEKIKYLFKVLYKFESMLHKNAYKDTPVQKTSQDIVDNLSEINRTTLSKLVTKDAL